MTLVAAPSASATAPVPRPPQPISPIRIGSSGAAWAVRTNGNSLKAAAPAAASEECLRNRRRETGPGALEEAGLFIISSIRLFLYDKGQCRPFQIPAKAFHLGS